MTSALNASARRKPPSAETGPCARTSAPIFNASGTSAAKASRFNRSHDSRERVTRQSRPAQTGMSRRKIKHHCFPPMMAAAWWISCNSGAGSHTLKTSNVPSNKAIAGTPSNRAALLLFANSGFGTPGRMRESC